MSTAILMCALFFAKVIDNALSTTKTILVHGFWLTPEAKDKVEKFYRIDNCKSQSEFLEKAINLTI